MIKFHLPDFYVADKLNMAMCLLIMDNKDLCIDDLQIGSIYGSFPCYWNGGRVMKGYIKDIDIHNIIDTFNNWEIPLRFTFTNALIDEPLLHDPQCNKIMRMANNGMNEVLVNSPLLEQYLRSEYPNFKYISSTTKCILDVDAFNRECEKYDLVVLDYRKNTDFDFIRSISDPSKVEILCNAYCSPNCAQRSKHYLSLSYQQLGLEDRSGFTKCNYNCRSFWDTFQYSSTVRSDNETAENTLSRYVNLGIQNFKIEGRTLHPMDVLDSYVYYLIKPEYRDVVRNLVYKKYTEMMFNDHRSLY